MFSAVHRAVCTNPFARVYRTCTSRTADSQQTHFWEDVISTTGLQSHECIRLRSLLPTIGHEALPPSKVCYTGDTLLRCRVQVCQDSVDSNYYKWDRTDRPFPIHHPINSPIDTFWGSHHDGNLLSSSCGRGTLLIQGGFDWKRKDFFSLP
ncbi:hypothetical protein BO82DRAFT_24752 [Aspergillus uvarum CBS 121591]|uniref:Uncharacterized protein n=1 Tax=Aspergillus uvarum CBS 121591 TaxID=1448315 RepID=A0A319CEU8_9EURO|nr:hypothetical protein BO82DRAFT_24752 [Aspergillus uvarum CBS 121591]PYH84205.1 hypothetical protein BO82DRAFT_24752 [Aspergillus uvarum CBS 121591]